MYMRSFCSWWAAGIDARCRPWAITVRAGAVRLGAPFVFWAEPDRAGTVPVQPDRTGSPVEGPASDHRGVGLTLVWAEHLDRESPKAPLFLLYVPKTQGRLA